MPYDDPDPTDPMTLHGVMIETGDDAAMREMAECFVEEYIRLGFDAERIVRLFQTRGYAGPFLAWQTLGESAIRRIIEDAFAIRGGRPKCTHSHGATALEWCVADAGLVRESFLAPDGDDDNSGDIGLPVLE